MAGSHPWGGPRHAELRGLDLQGLVQALDAELTSVARAAGPAERGAAGAGVGPSKRAAPGAALTQRIRRQNASYPKGY
jgi:hypothetical protein